MNATRLASALILAALLQACVPAGPQGASAAPAAGSGTAGAAAGAPAGSSPTAAAPGQPSAALPGYRDYPAVGVVKGFQSSGKVIILQHQDIAGLMEGMTMGFELKDPALAAGFKAGDAVDFTLSVKDSDYIVTALKKR